MRTPQNCSITSRGPFQQQHTEDEGESMASQTTGDSITSSTSFNLQERINDLRSRKIHRSSQSQNTDDDLINQNKSNKQNERNSKPCKDGFCYCFTSDSDDFRIHKSNDKKKSLRSETTEEQISDISDPKHQQRRRETFPLNSRKRHVPPKRGSPRRMTATCKLEDSSRISNAPLIHIIQEIRNNCVVSEVRVNKQKIPHKASTATNSIVTEQKIINVQPDIPISNNSHAYADRLSVVDSLAEHFEQSSLNTSSKSSDKNGGRLLQKRLSGTRIEYKPRNLSKPPRKPPRNLPASNSQRSSMSTAPSIREAEQILDEFLIRKGIPISKLPSRHKNNRKSYPLDKSVAPVVDQRVIYKKPLPSCPSLSDIESFGSLKSAKSCGIIQEPTFTWHNPKIREMLNLDAKSKNFQSNNPECGPQVGWTISPKLDIDTVDGALHNLVANMESKSTPVKTDMLNNKNESQKFIFTEQLRNFVSNSPWSNKKAKDKQNIKKSNSFLKSSKAKILRFVTHKSSPTKCRTIGVQTSAPSKTDCEKQQRFSLQSPPGSYFSNTPAKTSKSSQTEFDFSRTVHSPKRDKLPQRKLLFPTHNVLKEPLPRKSNTDNNQNQTYKSYTSDLDKDLTLSKMGQVLNNIRSRLEASDDHAVGTFLDIQRKEAAAASVFSYDCVDGCDYQKVYHISAQADVHNEAEPSYSEIEEESFFITASPVYDNTNGVEHFVLENDPKAIYAKINKTPKKSKPHSTSFNNIMEQNSPPKFRNVSKTDLSEQSEIFLENLTSENIPSQNRPYEKAEKVQNIQNEGGPSNGANNLDDSYVSVDSFRDSLAKDFDAVSYELPDDNLNPINAENATGNQSTPKKTIHLSKFGMDMMSNDALHQTTSCPATPGWLLSDGPDYIPVEESASLRDESTTTKDKAHNSRLWKYRTLKEKLRKSIRKSRHFLKNETKRISDTISCTKPLNFYQSTEAWDASSLCITNLFSMDNNAPVKDQLTQAVNLCRLIPELEVSPEMVEAERLLLFSSLKRNGKNPSTSITSQDGEPKGVVTFKSLRMPIKANHDHELFFNYYYIGVFSNGRQVKSTQSAECRNGEALFSKCNISFDNIKSESEIRCDLFMLRLRKVSTSRNPPSNAKLSLDSGSSDEVLSRFRPHASFVMRPRDFAPYHLVDSCSNTSENYFCLHAANVGTFSIDSKPRRTNSVSEVHVTSEAELLFRKYSKKGFLNVQDVSKKHSWNLRWCELEALRLNVWKCPNDVSINEPICSIELCKCKSFPIKFASREICARSRSFCLELESNDSLSTRFFSADNQSDLNYWISALNEVLEFIATWIK